MQPAFLSSALSLEARRSNRQSWGKSKHFPQLVCFARLYQCPQAPGLSATISCLHPWGVVGLSCFALSRVCDFEFPAFWLFYLTLFNSNFTHNSTLIWCTHMVHHYSGHPIACRRKRKPGDSVRIPRGGSFYLFILQWGWWCPAVLSHM